MLRFRTLLVVAITMFAALSISHAQSSIILYTQPGFNPWGFLTKLTDGLKNNYGSRFMTKEQPALEHNLESAKVGDMVCQIISTDYRCEGKTHYAVTIIFWEIDRDKYNSVQKVYRGASAGVIREESQDLDVRQYLRMITENVK